MSITTLGTPVHHRERPVATTSGWIVAIILGFAFAYGLAQIYGPIGTPSLESGTTGAPQIVEDWHGNVRAH